MYAFVGSLARTQKTRDGSGGRGRTCYIEGVWSHMELHTNIYKNMMVPIMMLVFVFAWV